MIRWFKEMLLLSAVRLPPMLLFPAICLTLATHPEPISRSLNLFFHEEDN